MIHPKLPTNPNSNMLIGREGVFVDPDQIKPLILEKVIVKAKKAKEKDEFESKAELKTWEKNDNLRYTSKELILLINI